MRRSIGSFVCAAGSRGLFFLALFPVLSGCAGEDPSTSPPILDEAAHRAEIEEWSRARLERLTSDTGWLTLVALDWLEPGANRMGSDPAGEIVLPGDTTPARIGFIVLEGEKATFTAEPSVEVTLDGQAVARTELASDAEGEPTVLETGSLSFYLIRRGDRLGLRVKDGESAGRREFAGIDTYSISTDWVIPARFESYDPPKEIPIANVVGTVEANPSPGALVFEAAGETRRLDALDGGDDELWLIFADATSGHGTYGAGRYLYVSRPDVEGGTAIDFNKAYNPPCAFTDYATCPLPPPQNRLAFAVEAGEKFAGH